jgi:hypothetical protein
MWYTSPSHIFTNDVKSKTITSFNYANLIKECTTSNIDIITFKPNKDSTSINKDKLDLIEGIVGASNPIFIKKSATFRQDMFDKTNHRDPSCLNVPHNFVALNFHDFCQFGKLQMPFRVMIKITIKELQQIFNVRNQR